MSAEGSHNNNESWASKWLKRIVIAAVCLAIVVGFGLAAASILAAGIAGKLIYLGLAATLAVTAILVARNGGVRSMTLSDETFS